MQELASIIKLSSYNTFSLFECRKAVTGSKSSESGIGMSWVILPYLIILLFTDQSVNAKADMICIYVIDSRNIYVQSYVVWDLHIMMFAVNMLFRGAHGAR